MNRGSEINTRPWTGLGCLALLALEMFFDMLFAPGSRVLGDSRDDLALHFLWWREFGFGELAKGNLALWNPHIFSGAPFFGGMQSALLYPPNWLFLALPLPLEIPRLPGSVEGRGLGSVDPEVHEPALLRQRLHPAVGVSLRRLRPEVQVDR